MLAIPTLTNSAMTCSALISAFLDKVACRRSISALTAGMVSSLGPPELIVFAEYPARTPAAIALQSSMYSSTNRRCIGVNSAIWG